MKPNKKFELSVKDLELIENALHRLEPTREVQELLGRLHNQKKIGIVQKTQSM